MILIIVKLTTGFDAWQINAEGDKSTEEEHTPEKKKKQKEEKTYQMISLKWHFRNDILLFHLFIQSLISEDGVHGIILCDLWPPPLCFMLSTFDFSKQFKEGKQWYLTNLIESKISF